MAGGTGSYNVTVTNRGAMPAPEMVSLALTLPPALRVTSTDGFATVREESGGVVRLTLPAPPAPGASVSARVTVQVARDAPPSVVLSARLGEDDASASVVVLERQVLSVPQATATPGGPAGLPRTGAGPGPAGQEAPGGPGTAGGVFGLALLTLALGGSP